MSAKEAQGIFDFLETNTPKLHGLVIADIFYSNSVVNVLSRFLQKSLMLYLHLVHTGEEDAVRLSEAMFTSASDVFVSLNA